MPVEVKIPAVGESITEVQIAEWSIQEGDSIRRDDTIFIVESDKATLEVPSPVSGTLVKILKQAGEEAEVGEVVGHIEEGEVEETSEKSEKKSESSEESARQESAGKKSAPAGDAKVMPAAQRLLDEKGLSADDVEGTGKGGRILKEDVQRHESKDADSAQSAESKERPAKEAPTKASPARSAPQPATSTPVQPDPTAMAAHAPGSREDEVVPVSFLRKRIAKRLVEAQQTAALLTTFNEVDMTNVKALRAEHQDAFTKKYGIKLGFMSFFVKASVDALQQIPQMNAEFRGDEIVYHNYCDVGIAVGGGKGLVVPILRNAERMGFAEVELKIAEFADKAKEGKLTPAELTGGTFTISNGGVYGSLLSTPIVNPPQSGILGLHGIQDRPVALNGEVVIRPMMYIALTYDHRIVDGREAVTFLRRIKDCVEHPERMLLEI